MEVCFRPLADFEPENESGGDLLLRLKKNVEINLMKTRDRPSINLYRCSNARRENRLQPDFTSSDWQSR